MKFSALILAFMLVAQGGVLRIPGPSGVTSGGGGGGPSIGSISGWTATTGNGSTGTQNPQNTVSVSSGQWVILIGWHISANTSEPGAATVTGNVCGTYNRQVDVNGQTYPNQQTIAIWTCRATSGGTESFTSQALFPSSSSSDFVYTTLFTVNGGAASQTYLTGTNEHSASASTAPSVVTGSGTLSSCLLIGATNSEAGSGLSNAGGATDLSNTVYASAISIDAQYNSGVTGSSTTFTSLWASSSATFIAVNMSLC